MTKFLVRLFVKNADDTQNVKVRKGYGTLSGAVGMICNLFLCSIKIAIGYISGSIAITADGFNNLTDMGSGVITMAGFKMAAKPADKDHPFGHGRMEYLSAFIVSCFILLVGVELFKSSLGNIISGEAAPRYTLFSYVILVVSIAVKLWLYIFNKKLSSVISSSALKAVAQDSVNDCIATAAILSSALVTEFVSLTFNLDAVMGICVSLFILYSGFSAAKETVDKLLGQPPAEELIKDLEDTIMSFTAFEGIHDLIIHNYGPGRCLASVHVEVSQNINVVYCHEQIDLCERFVEEKLGVELTIHCDPVATDSEDVTAARAAVSAAVKTLHPNASIHDFRMTPMSETRTNLIFDAVLPQDAKMSETEYKEKISELAKEINPTFVCVITVDRDYTGK